MAERSAAYPYRTPPDQRPEDDATEPYSTARAADRFDTEPVASSSSSAAQARVQLHGPLAESPDGDIHDYGDHPDHPENRCAATASPQILDACCGGRMWWWDKNHPLAVYMDKRKVGPQSRDVLPVNPGWECRPDIRGDFRQMPFADDEFQLVVFDPPHNVRREINGRMSIQYGSLHPETYPDDLRRGFAECWRVLRPGGTLVFKWAGPRARVEPHFPAPPIVGTRSSRGGTQWFIFYKPLDSAALDAVA